MTHQCPVGDCEAQVSTDYAMCGKHWRRVPEHLRKRVWATWSARLEASTPESIQAHRGAVDAATAAVEAGPR